MLGLEKAPEFFVSQNHDRMDVAMPPGARSLKKGFGDFARSGTQRCTRACHPCATVRPGPDAAGDQTRFPGTPTIAEEWRRGNSTINRLPLPGSLCTPICAPCAVQIDLAMDNPKPAPLVTMPHRSQTDVIPM